MTAPTQNSETKLGWWTGLMERNHKRRISELRTKFYFYQARAGNEIENCLDFYSRELRHISPPAWQMEFKKEAEEVIIRKIRIKCFYDQPCSVEEWFDSFNDYYTWWKLGSIPHARMEICRLALTLSRGFDDDYLIWEKDELVGTDRQDLLMRMVNGAQSRNEFVAIIGICCNEGHATEKFFPELLTRAAAWFEAGERSLSKEAAVPSS